MAGIRFEHHPFRHYGDDSTNTTNFNRPYIQAMEDNQDADTTVVIIVLDGGVMLDILDRKIQKFETADEVIKETYHTGPATEMDSFEQAFAIFKMHRASNPCVLFNFTGIEIPDLSAPVIKWDAVTNADPIPVADRKVVPYTAPTEADK